jgi:uncharacterized protein YuzE
VRLAYDSESDSLYLQFTENKIVESEEVHPGVVLDYDEKDQVVAIEVINLSLHMPDADIIGKGLELAGLTVKLPYGG